jgi:hypothetical protein
MALIHISSNHQDRLLKMKTCTSIQCTTKTMRVQHTLPQQQLRLANSRAIPLLRRMSTHPLAPVVVITTHMMSIRDARVLFGIPPEGRHWGWPMMKRQNILDMEPLRQHNRTIPMVITDIHSEGMTPGAMMDILELCKYITVLLSLTFVLLPFFSRKNAFIYLFTILSG